MSRRQVAFSYDLTRVPANRLEDTVPNIRWIERLIGPILAADGWEVARVLPEGSGGSFDVEAFMRAAGSEEPGRKAWAHLWGLRELPREASGKLREAFRDASLVIGGLPTWMMRFLDAEGISFVDLEVDPVRFCRSPFYRVRTNDRGIRARLAEIEVGEEEIRTQARLLKASFACGPAERSFAGCGRIGVFAGQMDFDAALVQEGRIRGLEEHAKRISEAADSVDLLLARPHPLMRKLSNLDPVFSAAPNVVLTSFPTYELLSLDAVEWVMAFSSSVLTEAAYFDKRALRLGDPDFFTSRLGAVVGGREYRVGAEFFQSDFWKSIGAGRSGWGGRRKPLSRTPSDLGAAIRESYQSVWGNRNAPGLVLRRGERVEPRLLKRQSGFFSFGWRPARDGSGDLRVGFSPARVCFRVEGGGCRLELALQVDADVAGPVGGRVHVSGSDGEKRRFDCTPESRRACVELEVPPQLVRPGGFVELVIEVDSAIPREDWSRRLGLDSMEIFSSQP